MFPQSIFFDSCMLWNWECTGEQQKLREKYKQTKNTYWTTGVKEELLKNSYNHVFLKEVNTGDWLEVYGTQLSKNDLRAILKIQIRLGGDPSGTSQHLGEAECIVFAKKVGPSGSFASDDKEALKIAKHDGITVTDTVKVLEEMISYGEYTQEEAENFVEVLETKGRGLIFEHLKSSSLWKNKYE